MDIVELLREDFGLPRTQSICDAAADEIEKLRAQRSAWLDTDVSAAVLVAQEKEIQYLREQVRLLGGDA